MKILKLDHDVVQDVLNGSKRTTWRMYDDKDISVHDELELLDKVDPKDRSTWRPIGIAKVTQVVEKPLKNITELDTEGHKGYSSVNDILATFRKRHGDHVTLETPIKIIHFSFQPVKKQLEETVVDTTAAITDVILYADGGSRGNPGPSACGFVLYDASKKILQREGIYLGITTNNQAEYLGLKFGLEAAVRHRAKTVQVYLDSMLVVNQMTGRFKVRNRDLWPIHEAIKQLIQKFEQVSFTHVPRELNKEADAAVNEAMDAELDKNQV